jgi:hypothetical protein
MTVEPGAIAAPSGRSPKRLARGEKHRHSGSSQRRIERQWDEIRFAGDFGKPVLPPIVLRLLDAQPRTQRGLAGVSSSLAWLLRHFRATPSMVVDKKS